MWETLTAIIPYDGISTVGAIANQYGAMVMTRGFMALGHIGTRQTWSMAHRSGEHGSLATQKKGKYIYGYYNPEIICASMDQLYTYMAIDHIYGLWINYRHIWLL